MKIAMIPARGGSKRIPGKNIKLFYGKPIIAYSIEAALASGCFDEVIVSTDDQEIAEVAKKYGAKIPFLRPDNIADDFATTNDVIKHAIQWYQEKGNIVEQLCCIYATAPFITSADILKGYELLTEECDFVFSAGEFSFPIQRAIKIADDRSVNMFEPEHELTRSQDLEPSFHDAGQFYWGQAQSFLDGKGFFSSRSKAVILPKERVQDIDTPSDWAFAEKLYKISN